MKNKILLMWVVLLPFIALATPAIDIIELRAKIKEISEEFRIVCRGDNKYSYRVGSNSKAYCDYLETEVDKYIKKLEKITNKYEEKGNTE